MKKILLFFGALAGLYAEPLSINSSAWPDFRLSMKPFLWSDTQGVSGIFEGGRQQIRCNATYGADFNGSYGKISLEYLTQRLGIQFASRHEHLWVEQGALGIGGCFPVGFKGEDYPVDCTFRYSKSRGRSLFSEVLPLKNEICDKKIAGSDAFALSCKTAVCFEDYGTVSGALIYDAVWFHRTFKKDKVILGPGIQLGFDRRFFTDWNLHLGVNVEAPYIVYDASINSRMRAFGREINLGIYGQRVLGQKGIPNTSRIGIECSLDFEQLFTGKKGEVSCFANWLKTPAVYMPEVLVIADHKIRPFNAVPEVIAPIGDIYAAFGDFEWDASPYFSGGAPLIFSAIGLPSPLRMNPVTGKITGFVDDSLVGTFSVAIKAANASGAAIERMNLHI